ncbi:MAG: WYL domain-containing protein [Deltaproteobacteria bacterium]|nr:WYL domain-containing protein [Deltaproteobacteria bacterium]
MNKTPSKAIFAEKGMRLVRSWETMMLLAESNKPLTTQEINEMVHRHYPFSLNQCNVQTTSEDLKTLQKCGFPLCRFDQDGQEISFTDEPGRGRYKNTTWCLRNPAKSQDVDIPFLRQPTVSDVLSISLCRALLKDEIPSQYPFRRTMAKVLEELQLQLFRKLRHEGGKDVRLYNKIRNLGREYVGKTVNSKIWETVIHTIANHTVVEAEYTNRENETGKGFIAPLSVWFAEGRAYLLAVDLETDAFKVWRLDRFTAMEPAPSKQAPQIAEEEIEQAMRQSFKGYVATPEQVKLLVKARATYLFREFKYHESQQLQEQPDGDLIVTMECATGWGFEEWLLGLGEFVTVLKPVGLSHSLQQRIKKMADLYQQKENQQE